MTSLVCIYYIYSCVESKMPSMNHKQMEDKMKKMILIVLALMATNVQAQQNRFEQKEKIVTKDVTKIEFTHVRFATIGERSFDDCL